MMGAGIEESTEDAARWLGGEGGGRPADTMDRIEEILASGGPIPVDAVTRPHALVVAAWRVVATPNGRAQERLAVGFVPAEGWDRARDLLVPLAERLAAGAALLVLIGRPNDPSIAKAASRGLAAVLPHDAGADDVTIAAHHAFELLENKGRAEARGRWLRRYRYELGELIHIARAMTTVRDVDQLLGVILENAPEKLLVVVGQLGVDTPRGLIGGDGIVFLPAPAAEFIEVSTGVNRAVKAGHVKRRRIRHSLEGLRRGLLRMKAEGRNGACEQGGKQGLRNHVYSCE